MRYGDGRSIESYSDGTGTLLEEGEPGYVLNGDKKYSSQTPLNTHLGPEKWETEKTYYGEERTNESVNAAPVRKKELITVMASSANTDVDQFWQHGCRAMKTW